MKNAKPVKKSTHDINHVIDNVPNDTNVKNITVTISKSENIIVEMIELKFDTSRNLCRIYTPSVLAINYLPQILPADCYIWYCGDDVSNLMDIGFTNPFHCKRCPFGEKFKPCKIAVSRKNDPLFDTNSRERYIGNDDTPEDFQRKRTSPKRKTSDEYMLEFTKNHLKDKNPVELKIKFDIESLLYLKGLIVGSNTINGDGEITQKEVSGILQLEKRKENFILNIDESKRFNAHDEDTVRFVTGLINFHTHPISIYEKFDVDMLYPSPDDYISILTLLLQPYYFENMTGMESPAIFSCVITKEGVYIVSLNKNYCTKSKIKKLRESICDINYEFTTLKTNVAREMRHDKDDISGFIYGDTIDYDIYYETHCKYIGDPIDHPLGFRQVGGFNYDTFEHNRKKEQLLHFPETKKSRGYTYDRITQAGKDYCLKMNRRELISGIKFKGGNVLNVEFYNYEELQNESFSVYTYTVDNEILEPQLFLNEDTIEAAIHYSNDESNVFN